MGSLSPLAGKKAGLIPHTLGYVFELINFPFSEGGSNNKTIMVYLHNAVLTMQIMTKKGGLMSWPINGNFNTIKIM